MARSYGKGGPSRQQVRADQLRGSFTSGPGRVKKATRGKGGDPERVVYDSNYDPSSAVAKKGDFDYKGDTSKGAEKFVAGANILDSKGKETKRKSFDEHLKSGGRANDPRNWEFHYKDPGKRKGKDGKVYRRTWSQTKGMSAQEKKNEAYNSAQMRAKKNAKLTGKDIYEVQKIEYETQGIVQESDAARAKSKAIGGAGAFGSTRVAANVAAAKMKSNRQTGRAKARQGAAFAEPPKKRGAIA